MHWILASGSLTQFYDVDWELLDLGGEDFPPFLSCGRIGRGFPLSPRSAAPAAPARPPA